ncbi:chemotaxis protein [Brachyspira hyodysenteriae]|uniref:PDC sensor domain-containing protein n=1 Tax=Brachyspira hyodysenteriae TaxID=159 RepID=UPI0022CD8960|nr:chemotaxis protein [Brachyspira hyodysenteriae]MCZ9938452.1 chemotaxis protein [Brachyspira hyodysenteriae]MDA0054068.1 chemotaxis protein [Brachyspira hyodysenteriae]
MNSKNSLNIKASLFVIIPTIIIIVISGIVAIIHTFNISKKDSLVTVEHISEVELLNMRDLINNELNYMKSIKLVAEELYSSNIKNRNIYENFMYKFSKKISKNVEAVFLIFLPNVIDNDSMYKNNSLYKNINGQFGIYMAKDENGNISRFSAENLYLKLSFIDDTIEKKEMCITPIYTIQTQNGYKQVQTCLMPIFSNDDEIIGVIGLDVSSDSMNFNKGENITTTLFDERGNIIYCNNDIEIIGENFTNLYHPYNNYNVLDIINSNESLIVEKYNFKNLNRYFHVIKPINLFDNVYWGIEVAIPSIMVLKNNYKIAIMIGIMVSIMIILIIIIVPNIINKKVIPVINFFNKTKVKSDYTFTDDKIIDMNTDEGKTIKYLNDIIEAVKGKIYYSKSEVLHEQHKSNSNYKFVNEASENSKSLSEESEELKNIIEYFKLIK